VPGKRTLTTLAVVTLAVLAGSLFVSSRSVTSIPKARESVLQQNLFTLRTLLDEYVADKPRRPQSLDELVVFGHLKQVPTDLMTGRND